MYTLGFTGCQVHNVLSRVFKIVLYTVFPACYEEDFKMYFASSHR